MRKLIFIMDRRSIPNPKSSRVFYKEEKNEVSYRDEKGQNSEESGLKS